MLVDRRTWNHLVKAYDYVTSNLDERTPFIFKVDPIILKSIKSRIIKEVPETYKKKISKLIDEILKNIEKVRMVYEGKVKEVNEFAFMYFMSRLRPSLEVDLQKAGELLLNYVPVNVEYLTRSGKRVEGVALYPSDIERKFRIILIDYCHVENILHHIAKNNTILDEETGIMRIFNEMYKLHPLEFYKASEILGDWTKGAKYLEKYVKEKFAKNYKVSVDFGGEIIVKLNLSDAESSIVPKSLLEKTEITIKGRNERWVVFVRNELMKFSFVKEGKFDELDKIIEDAKQDAVKYIDKFYHYAVDIKNFAESINAKLEKGDVWYVYGEKSPEYIIHTNSGFNLRIALKDKPTITLYYTTTKERRRISETDLKYVLEDLSKYGEISTEVWGTRISVNVKFNENVDVFTAYVIGKDIVGRVEKLIKFYDETKKSAKIEAGKLTPEHYVTLYLIKHALFKEMNFELLTGRSETVMYSVVGRVLKKVDSGVYHEIKEKSLYSKESPLVEYSYRVINSLIKNGYVTLDEDGVVKINGRSIIDLLSSFKGIDPITIMEINVSLGAEVLMRVPQEKLDEVLSTPGRVCIAILNTYVPVTPDILLKKYKGETIWEQLPTHVKEHYLLKRASPNTIYKILTDEKYKIISEPYKNLLILHLTELDTDLATKYIAKYMPDLISDRRLNLYEVENFTGIDAGKYVVQVNKLEGLDRNSVKRFLVFLKSNKLGFPVKARTLEEAIEKANKLAPRFLNEIEELRRLERRTPLVRLYENKVGGGFKLPSVVLRTTFPAEEILVKPGTLNIVKSKIEEYKKRKERVSESISS